MSTGKIISAGVALFSAWAGVSQIQQRGAYVTQSNSKIDRDTYDRINDQADTSYTGNIFNDPVRWLRREFIKGGGEMRKAYNTVVGTTMNAVTQPWLYLAVGATKMAGGKPFKWAGDALGLMGQGARFLWKHIGASAVKSIFSMFSGGLTTLLRTMPKNALALLVVAGLAAAWQFVRSFNGAEENEAAKDYYDHGNWGDEGF